MDNNNGNGAGRSRGVGRPSKPLEDRGNRPGDTRRPTRGPTRGPGRDPQQGQRTPAGGAFREEQLSAGPSSAVGSTSGPRRPGSAITGPRPSAPSNVGFRGHSHVAEPRPLKVKEEIGAIAKVGPGGDSGGNGGNGGNGMRGAMRGKRVIHEVIKTRPTTCASKKGATGKEVALQTNFYLITKKPEWTLNQYRVDFSPDVELLRVRRGMLGEHRNLFGGYLFDGTVLFTPTKIQADPVLELVSKNNEGELYKITIKFVGVIEMYDYQYLQILNLILRRSMEGLKLQLVGRNLFDALAKVDISQYRLELWPGYRTSIRQHEQDILLCVDITHKVMRTETIYNILQNCINDSRNYQEAFKREVIGMIVLTDYNNKTYRIDDVDFGSSPNSKFSTKNGDITYKEYYRTRYKLNIRDPNQPLLVSKSTERNLRAGQDQLIMLVPELCRATGINDSMRKNFQLMKAMSDHTRLSPRMRIERLKQFNQRLRNTPDSMQVLNSWQVGLDQNLVEISGRILKQEFIVFGNKQRVQAGPEADWTRELRNISMFSIAHLSNWFVIVPSRNRREATDFIKFVIQAARGMKMNIQEPQYSVINDDRNNSYVGAIEGAAKRDPQLIFAVVPNDNAERYGCIKKKLCVDRPIPSQVVITRTITPKKGKPPSSLMSIATKVAIQMNCKLMGAPWMIELPLAGLMTVGFDVCHSTRDPTKSYGALVATMDLKVSTRFFSTVSLHNKGQELSNDIALNMTKALKEYRELHGKLPDRILFYRDGVGEGQLHQVVDTEVTTLVKRLNEIYNSAGIEAGCPITYIVVSKQINSRYFHEQNNPPPGTVVDDVITLPERYDFYLVSQSVRQGTVSPTGYNVIYDKMGLGADRLQILTYKFTHLYYNFTGTTRVPATCQYAHKLAFLVGQSIHQAPQNLDKQLYYL